MKELKFLASFGNFKISLLKIKTTEELRSDLDIDPVEALFPIR